MRKLFGNLLANVLLAAFIVGVLGVFAPVNHGYWNKVFLFISRDAPNSIVAVSVSQQDAEDSASMARLLQELRRTMPSRVFVDANLTEQTGRPGDDDLRDVIASYGKDIGFVAWSKRVDHWAPSNFSFPSAAVIGNAPVYVSGWDADFLEYPESSPYSVKLDGKRYQTLSSALAGVTEGLEPKFSPDFFINPGSIVQLSSSNLRSGQFTPGLLTGRTIIVIDSAHLQPFSYLGHGAVPRYAFDVAGAAGLKKPVQIMFGGATMGLAFLPMFIWTALLLWLASHERRRGQRYAIYIFAIISNIIFPVGFRALGVIATPDTGLFMIAIYVSARLWQKRTRRIQHTSSSGLPNLLALTSHPVPVGQDVIVSVIARWEEILATLPKDLHGELARQVAKRLSIGSGRSEIYHDDGGHFAWLDEARPLETQLNHLEGLRALFSAPLQIGDHTFDTNIHFGLDRNEGLDAPTRINSALASATEALKNGRTVEYFEASRLAEAPWELSLHARIDEGLRNGDIWLAYQPQWDYKENRISGAEALIRWNHPTRGPIQPDAFILQAERAGRIDTLTYWVLEQAITAAETMNGLGPRFQLSINLSAQMVDKPSLVSSISEIVRRRGIDCRLLTIEVTETSSVHNRPAARHNLGQLRAMGFRLSIDDFGTGEASLTYLAELPSDELKLDRRFVAAITSSERNRTIVSSTIGLAHALGQVVVAEGIEDIATFNMLREMRCDSGQGYFIGRPQPFAQLRDLSAGMGQKRRADPG